MRASRTACLAAAVVMVGSAMGASASAARPSPPRTISFSGHTWQVKSSAGRMGPGPNYFSNSTDNVWVDGDGRLHLRITNRNGRWYCAEVILQGSFGYGSYRWVLDSEVHALDPSVVLGMFTWNDAQAYDHREMDVEMARWGNTADPTNAQYVVQPHDAAGHLVRFSQPAGAPTSVHGFTWAPTSIAFQSARGTALPPAPGDEIAAWTFGGEVPIPGGENPRINLWLFRGAAPTDGQEVEVVVRTFAFIR